MVSHMCVNTKVGILCIPRQVCLLSRYLLVLTCVVCLEIVKSSFLPFVRGETEIKARASQGQPPPLFHQDTPPKYYKYDPNT